MKDVHIAVGVLAIALNSVAGLYGAWCWWRAVSAVPGSGGCCGLGQAVIVLQAALGGVLVLMGHKPPRLHLIYGLLPLLRLVHRRAAAGRLGADGARRSRV